MLSKSSKILFAPPIVVHLNRRRTLHTPVFASNIMVSWHNWPATFPLMPVRKVPSALRSQYFYISVRCTGITYPSSNISSTACFASAILLRYSHSPYHGLYGKHLNHRLHEPMWQLLRLQWLRNGFAMLCIHFPSCISSAARITNSFVPPPPGITPIPTSTRPVYVSQQQSPLSA